MQVNGTLINYYFHCRRQCYLHGNRLNLEDNSEQVKIGKAIHEEKAGDSKNSEIAIDNIRLDRLTKEYLTEVKKSDADAEAAKWQLLFYLKEEIEMELDNYISSIEQLLVQEKPPECIQTNTCKKCAYYEYCYI